MGKSTVFKRDKLSNVIHIQLLVFLLVSSSLMALFEWRVSMNATQAIPVILMEALVTNSVQIATSSDTTNEITQETTLFERIVLHMFVNDSSFDVNLVRELGIDFFIVSFPSLDLKGFPLQPGETDLLLSEVAKFTNLTSLDISGLGLTSIEPLSSLVLLEVLVANDNAIRDITPLQNVLNLRTIQLQGNPVAANSMNRSVINNWKTAGIEYYIDNIVPSLTDLTTTAGRMLITEPAVVYHQAYSSSSNVITLSVTPVNTTNIQAYLDDSLVVGDAGHLVTVFDSVQPDLIPQINKNVLVDGDGDGLVDAMTLTVHLLEGVNRITIDLQNGYLKGYEDQNNVNDYNNASESSYTLVIDYTKAALIDEGTKETPDVIDPIDNKPADETVDNGTEINQETNTETNVEIVVETDVKTNEETQAETQEENDVPITPDIPTGKDASTSNDSIDGVPSHSVIVDGDLIDQIETTEKVSQQDFVEKLKDPTHNNVNLDQTESVADEVINPINDELEDPIIPEIPDTSDRMIRDHNSFDMLSIMMILFVISISIATFLKSRIHEAK